LTAPSAAKPRGTRLPRLARRRQLLDAAMEVFVARGYHAAAMDGVAVRAADTAGATETTPRRLKIGEQAIWVDTGDPLPSGTDAVIITRGTMVRAVLEAAQLLESAGYGHI